MILGFYYGQKQSSRGVLSKICPEIMQQILQEKTHVEVWNHTPAWMFSFKFAVYFQKKLFLTASLDGCFWMDLLYYYASEITYFFALEFTRNLNSRRANFKLSERLYFIVFFVKIVPLRNDSIVNSTIFRETYCTSANLNRAGLKLNKNEFNSDFNTIR